MKNFNYDNEYFAKITDTWTKSSYPVISEYLVGHLSTRKVNDVLDLGCGRGVYSGILLEHSANVFGVDISEDACDFCGKLGYTEVFNASVDNIPIENDKLDFVFTTEVLEHILDHKKMLSEIYRILKKDGSLLLTTTCYSTSIFEAVRNQEFRFKNYFDYLFGFFNKNYRDNFIRKFCFESLGGHYHGFLPPKLLADMRNIGFIIESYKLFTPYEIIFLRDGKQMLKKVFSKKTQWPFYKRLFAAPVAILFTVINFTINFSHIFQNNILIIAKKPH